MLCSTRKFFSWFAVILPSLNIIQFLYNYAKTDAFLSFFIQPNFSLVEIVGKIYQLRTLKKTIFDFKCTKTKQFFFFLGMKKQIR